MRNNDQRLMNQRAMDQGGERGINRQVLEMMGTAGGEVEKG